MFSVKFVISKQVFPFHKSASKSRIFTMYNKIIVRNFKQEFIGQLRRKNGKYGKLIYKEILYKV